MNEKLTQFLLQKKIESYNKKLEETKNKLFELSQIFSKRYYDECFYLKGIIETLNEFIIQEDNLSTIKANTYRDDITEDDVINHFVSFQIRDILKYQIYFNHCSNNINNEEALIYRGKIQAIVEFTQEFDLLTASIKYLPLLITK